MYGIRSATPQITVISIRLVSIALSIESRSGTILVIQGILENVILLLWMTCKNLFKML